MSSGYSYNGWPANSDPAAIGVVQSLWFPGGVKAGDVTTVFRYLAEQFNARVEPIVGGWCWGYTYKQNVNDPSSLSCHASGTALDVNAPDHPNGSGGTFTDSQVGVIYAILDECAGAVSWLQGYDEMHFEIQVGAADLAAIAATLPTGGGTPPPNTGDWFDMATRQDLDDAIAAAIPAIAVAVWQQNVSDRSGADLLNSAAVNAEAANRGVGDLPTNVWTKTVTDESAADLLARAAGPAG